MIITTTHLSIALITRIIKLLGKDIKHLSKASNIRKQIKLEKKTSDHYFYDKKIEHVFEAAEEAVFFIKHNEKGVKPTKELWKLV